MPIYKTWQDLISILSLDKKTSHAINFLLAGLIDTDSIVETQFNSEKIYNPAKIPIIDRKRILDLESSRWNLYEYLNKKKCTDRYDDITQKINQLYFDLFPSKHHVSSVNLEIMQLIHAIIACLPLYESKQSLIQKNKHQGSYYISRKNCITEIDLMLGASSENCVIICAPAGMGKKSTALEYVIAYKCENVIWIPLPTTNISMEEQITISIVNSKEYTPSSYIDNIDLSELLDSELVTIIIERPYIDENDYSFICNTLHFTKSRLIVLTPGISPNIDCSIYNLPAFNKSDLWSFFQETIKIATNSVENINLISKTDFNTILAYTGSNTLLISLIAKAIGLTNLSEENKNNVRDYVLKHCLSTDHDSPLPYLTYKFPNGQRNHQPYSSIIKNVLIPIVASQNKHFYRFPDICFFVRGKCSTKILSLLFDHDDIKPIITEMLKFGYVESLNNDIINIYPFMSDTIWNYSNDRRNIDKTQEYIIMANKVFATDRLNLLREDAPYYFSLLETVYYRLTSLIPLIGGQDSRKAGKVVEKSWEDYWKLLLNVFFLSYKIGNYNLANTMLDTLYSWKTAQGFKGIDNKSYFWVSDLLHLISTMSLGTHEDILNKFDSSLNNQQAASYDSSFLGIFYQLYFDFIFRHIFSNVVCMLSSPNDPYKAKINNTLEAFFTYIKKSNITNDLKLYFDAYARSLHAINGFSNTNTIVPDQEMSYAQAELLYLFDITDEKELKLSAIFLYDLFTLIYSLHHPFVDPQPLSFIKEDIQRFGLFIENHLVSLTLSEHYYATKLLYATLSAPPTEISITIIDTLQSIFQQTQASLLSYTLHEYIQDLIT